ncbi:PTS sugar transporter subunit IIA [Hirschia baltica]|uniref:PTS system fructose subfamily IIA component n=1 Tax=Hirschia baltica (strain ATCC 49814 / DSM 5838 / IFAM 1418) TaxID=582402 RepID=C6XL62_HIRBI|nr:PTS sugar transporter subunit IIA [Hirschia baltica]ACT57891.1 PTS system fructose subfamily IIA component [Hirschia baltica ATCC 49814]
MIGVVVVTHGGLAREFVAATEHVFGAQDAFEAICIDADDDMELRRQEIIDVSEKCDTGDGVIVFTDMFGGTPSNLAISVMTQAKIEVIAGVNLPMLIKVAEVRKDRPMDEVALAVQDAGRKYISIASVVLQKSA